MSMLLKSQSHHSVLSLFNLEMSPRRTDHRHRLLDHQGQPGAMTGGLRCGVRVLPEFFCELHGRFRNQQNHEQMVPYLQGIASGVAVSRQAVTPLETAVKP